MLLSDSGGGPDHQQKAHSVKYQNLSHYGEENNLYTVHIQLLFTTTFAENIVLQNDSYPK